MELAPLFLLCLSRRDGLGDNATTIQNGTTRTNINFEQWSSLKVPYPVSQGSTKFLIAYKKNFLRGLTAYNI